MYTIFYKKEFDPNDYSFSITEDEMIDNQFIVDISKLGNISYFWFSDAFYENKQEIDFTASLNIWFSRFYLYKEFIDFVGDKQTDLNQVLTGYMSIFLKDGILFNWVSYSDTKLKFGKLNFFYYNPEKNNVSISFKIPNDNSFMKGIP